LARILTITSWYPPHHFGGYELSCFDVMSRFVARGHEVRVLCGDERVAGARLADPAHEAFVHRELRPHWREASSWRPRLPESVAIERHNRRVLERHLDEFRPDVVSVWHMLAISATLLRHLTDRDIPVVYAVCDDWPVYMEKFDAWTSRFTGSARRNWTGRAVEALTRLPTTAGDYAGQGAFCFVSDALLRRVVDDRPWSFCTSTVVYSGIDRALFPALGGPPERSAGWRLAYIGRLDERKGVATLLRALPHLPAETTLACYGRGGAHDRARLEALARDLRVDNRVRFGSLERDQLAACYSNASVVVFPSEWEEPFGLVPLEAMACGTPVVATGVGGSGEFLRDGENCVIFPARDERALAAAVQRVHDDASLREQVVRGGLRTADVFTVDRLTDLFEAWHLAAADRFASGPPPGRAPASPAASAAVDDLPVEHHPGLTLELRGRRHLLHIAGRELVVAARPEQLPLRSGAIDAVIANGALERAADDRALVEELARVAGDGASAVFAAANRLDADALKARVRDRARGLRQPRRAYFASREQRREYTWRELERLVEPFFAVRARRAAGWHRGAKSRVATALVSRGPLRRFSRAIVLDTRRR
jgi:glycosyltransferase involved in cell wall biosynthesis